MPGGLWAVRDTPVMAQILQGPTAPRLHSCQAGLVAQAAGKPGLEAPLNPEGGGGKCTQEPPPEGGGVGAFSVHFYIFGPHGCVGYFKHTKLKRSIKKTSFCSQPSELPRGDKTGISLLSSQLWSHPQRRQN